MDVFMRGALYKRSMDLGILVAAHLFLLPVWVLLWTAIPLLIKLEDGGPVFYGQTRMGKNGKTFRLLKFRTMVPNADKIGPRWNVTGDKRVTRIGRVLRRTALDELPGLIAIWRGDMSFVGPRALDAIEHQMLEAQFPGFGQRLQVAPGLTGLAQVYNLTDAPDTKLQYDLEYIRTMSVWLDCKLILLSVKNTLTAKWDQRSGKPAIAAAPKVEEEAAAPKG
jgi:lipopolysaccharide/colanic/teichoic acid biosynthesis glycosyltransferase